MKTRESTGFAVGDFVSIGSDLKYRYEVAEIARFPHGIMIGIYDDPPSDHIDYWNPSSLKLVKKR